jgi:hypothetical protein
MLPKFDGSIFCGCAGFLLLFPALLYVVAPIVVKNRLTVKAVGTIHTVLAEQLPADVAAFIGATVQTLAPLGFRAVLSAREEDMTPGVTCYILVFVNAATGDTAMAQFAISSLPRGPQRVPTIMFSTKFPDGSSVITTTFSEPIYPPDPRVAAISLPDLRDATLLWEIHRRRRERLAPGAIGVPVPQGREIQALADENAKLLARVAAAGYLTLDADGERYRPTWKGACLMSWKLLPPLRQLRRARRRARARAELRELSIDLSPARN